MNDKLVTRDNVPSDLVCDKTHFVYSMNFEAKYDSSSQEIYLEM